MKTIVEVFAAIAYLSRLVASLEMGSNNLDMVVSEYCRLATEIEDYFEAPGVWHSLEEATMANEQLEGLEERFGKYIPTPVYH